MTHSPTPTELLALRTANAALLASPDSFCDMVATVVFALGSAQLLQSPETAAELSRLRDQVAEMEAEAYGDAKVRLVGPVERIRHLRNSLVAQMGRANTLNRLAREQRSRADAAEARVAELEAERTRPAPVIDAAAGLERLRAELAAQLEDPHDSPLHHEYRLGHDLPAPCAECQEPTPDGRAYCSTRCRNAADRHDANDYLAEEPDHAEL